MDHLADVKRLVLMVILTHHGHSMLLSARIRLELARDNHARTPHYPEGLVGVYGIVGVLILFLVH